MARSFKRPPPWTPPAVACQSPNVSSSRAWGQPQPHAAWQRKRAQFVQSEQPDAFYSSHTTYDLFHVRLPGVARRDLSIELRPRARSLVVRARRIRSEQVDTGSAKHVVTNVYRKRFEIPENVNPDAVEIRAFKDDVLVVYMPHRHSSR